MRVGLLSKITRNGCTSSLVSPKSSPFLKSNSSPVHLCSSSPHSTLSRFHLWKICSRNGVAGTIQRGGFPGSILSRTFFSNTLLKKTNVSCSNRRFSHSFTSLNRGRRSIFRRFTTDGVVIGLIVANVAVFILWRVSDTQFMAQNFMISVDNFSSGRLHTLITAAFSHREPFHLFSNMIGLYFFGNSIGQNFGPQYLLKLYLGGAIAGSIFYLAYHAFMAESFQSNQMRGMVSPSRIPGLGASGAVNAIMLLDIFLFPTRTVFFDLFIPMPAILLGVIIIGRDIVRVWQGDPQVSGSAHLGGATVAALAWLRTRKGRFGRF